MTLSQCHSDHNQANIPHLVSVSCSYSLLSIPLSHTLSFMKLPWSTTFLYLKKPEGLGLNMFARPQEAEGRVWHIKPQDIKLSDRDISGYKKSWLLTPWWSTAIRPLRCHISRLSAWAMYCRRAVGSANIIFVFRFHQVLYILYTGGTSYSEGRLSRSFLKSFLVFNVPGVAQYTFTWGYQQQICSSNVSQQFFYCLKP